MTPDELFEAWFGPDNASPGEWVRLKSSFRDAFLAGFAHGAKAERERIALMVDPWDGDIADRIREGGRP